MFTIWIAWFRLCRMDQNCNRDQVGPLLESCHIRVYRSLAAVPNLRIDLCERSQSALSSHTENLTPPLGFLPILHVTPRPSRTSEDIPCFSGPLPMFDRLLLKQVECNALCSSWTPAVQPSDYDCSINMTVGWSVCYGAKCKCAAEHHFSGQIVLFLCTPGYFEVLWSQC